MSRCPMPQRGNAAVATVFLSGQSSNSVKTNNTSGSLLLTITSQSWNVAPDLGDCLDSDRSIMTELDTTVMSRERQSENKADPMLYTDIPAEEPQSLAEYLDSEPLDIDVSGALWHEALADATNLSELRGTQPTFEWMSSPSPHSSRLATRLEENLTYLSSVTLDSEIRIPDRLENALSQSSVATLSERKKIRRDIGAALRAVNAKTLQNKGDWWDEPWDVREKMGIAFCLRYGIAMEGGELTTPVGSQRHLYSSARTNQIREFKSEIGSRNHKEFPQFALAADKPCGLLYTIHRKHKSFLEFSPFGMQVFTQEALPLMYLYMLKTGTKFQFTDKARKAVCTELEKKYSPSLKAFWTVLEQSAIAKRVEIMSLDEFAKYQPFFSPMAPFFPSVTAHRDLAVRQRQMATPKPCHTTAADKEGTSGGTDSMETFAASIDANNMLMVTISADGTPVNSTSTTRCSLTTVSTEQPSFACKTAKSNNPATFEPNQEYATESSPVFAGERLEKEAGIEDKALPAIPTTMQDVLDGKVRMSPTLDYSPVDWAAEDMASTQAPKEALEADPPDSLLLLNSHGLVRKLDDIENWTAASEFDDEFQCHSLFEKFDVSVDEGQVLRNVSELTVSDDVAVDVPVMTLSKIPVLVKETPKSINQQPQVDIDSGDQAILTTHKTTKVTRNGKPLQKLRIDHSPDGWIEEAGTGITFLSPKKMTILLDNPSISRPNNAQCHTTCLATTGPESLAAARNGKSQSDSPSKPSDASQYEKLAQFLFSSFLVIEKRLDQHEQITDISRQGEIQLGSRIGRLEAEVDGISDAQAVQADDSTKIKERIDILEAAGSGAAQFIGDQQESNSNVRRSLIALGEENYRQHKTNLDVSSQLTELQHLVQQLLKQNAASETLEAADGNRKTSVRQPDSLQAFATSPVATALDGDSRHKTSSITSQKLHQDSGGTAEFAQLAEPNIVGNNKGCDQRDTLSGTRGEVVENNKAQCKKDGTTGELKQQKKAFGTTAEEGMTDELCQMADFIIRQQDQRKTNGSIQDKTNRLQLEATFPRQQATMELLDGMDVHGDKTTEQRTKQQPIVDDVENAIPICSDHVNEHVP